MTTPITLSTAHATSSRRACVRLGRITRLLNHEKAGHVAGGLHGTAVAIDGARTTGYEALPVIDAGLAGLEGEGDDVHAPCGRSGAQSLERNEDSEAGDGERVGGGCRVGDRAEVALLRVALVVEVRHMEGAALNAKGLRPERIA